MGAVPRLARRSVLLGLAATAFAGGKVAFAAAPGERRLVVVLLRGAMDGLAVVAPYGDPDHAGLREGIALPEPGQEGGLLELGGFHGLHPALPGVHALYRSGEALWVHAVAGPHRTRSHFDGQDALESGAEARLEEGWLNRAIASLWPAEIGADGAARRQRASAASVAAPGEMRRGLAVGPQVPLLLRGRARVSGYAPPGAAALEPDQFELLAALYDADPLLGPAFREGRAGRGFAEDVFAKDHGPDANRPQPGRNVGELARRVGMLLADPAGPRVASFELGGWDTHAFQHDRLAAALRNLDLAVGSLREGLGAAWGQTVVLAMTEFGRTARVNGTMGTDHGTAGAVLVAGGAVAGGRVLGDWPGLSERALFQGRDLAPTTDLRSVTKAVLAGHLGVSRAALDGAVFPGSGSVQPMSGLLAS